jgi:hypothetical protein
VPRKPASEGLEAAIEALARALDQTGAPWMLIGGIAIIARGVRRMTTDVDAVVRGDAVSVEAVLRAMASEQIGARIDGAVAFAQENLVLLARHEPSGIDLDVSFAWSAFELDALRDATEAPFGRVRVRMSTAADLVVLKAIAGRPKDIQDAESLLVLHPDIDVERVRGRVAELAVLAEAPEIATSFDALVQRARPGRPAR